MALVQLPLRVPGGVPAHERGHGAVLVRGDHHCAAVLCRAHEGGGIEPPAQGLLLGAQPRAGEHLVAVQQQGRGVPALGHRFRPGVATTSAGADPTRARTVCSEDEITGTCGKALPSSSAVRPAPTELRRTLVKPHSAQLHSCAWRPHHVHTGTAFAEDRASGPSHARQRAGVRHRWQARTGA